WGFGSAAVGMVAGLIVYLLGRPKYLAGIGEPRPGSPNVIPLLFPVSLLLAAGVMAVYHYGGFGWLRENVRALFSNQAVAIAIYTGITVALLGWLAWFI